ncbi:hypothetical protein ACFX2C_037872 [Malus domestica]
MSATEYHQKFIDLSRYYPETALNPREMLHLFKRGTRKWLHYMVTTTPCITYQDFFEVLLRVEDLENAPDDEDKDDDRNVQRNNNMG